MPENKHRDYEPRKSFYDKLREQNPFTSDPQLGEHAIRLIEKMHLTQGARFEASRRHKKKNRISLVSIITLSLYAILFSLITTFDKVVPNEKKDVLAMLSIFMSSFILAFSVYEALKRYDARSEAFLVSARSISTLRDNLTALYMSTKLTWVDIKEIEHDYQAILATHADNHADPDYEIFRGKIGKLNPRKRRMVFATRLIATWWLLVFSIVSPAIVLMPYLTIVWAANKYFGIRGAAGAQMAPNATADK